MNYVENGIATFKKHATVCYKELAQTYTEKEKAYLSGTDFFRSRVLSNTLDNLKQELSLVRDQLLSSCKIHSPDHLPELEERLRTVYDEHVASFWRQFYQ